MAKRNTQQLGGRKEAPLAVGGSGNVAQEQERAVFVPNDAEYHRYSELLKGFFEKLIRWQGVLSAEEYLREEERRSGIVFRLDTGLIMTPVTSKEKYNPANKILKISNFTDRHPKPGLFGTRFFISSAPAGKHLLVDPSGKPLEKIEIHVIDQTIAPWGTRSLEIKTERLRDKPEGYFNYRRADYRFSGNTLKVSHKYSWYDVMTDEMATILINTIDALIPGAPPATPQPVRIPNQEIPTSKALLPARRRRPQRR